MPNPFRNDEALPDAQVIILIIDCVNALLFAKPVRQRNATQQPLIQGHEPNVDMVKFEVPFVNSRTVSHLQSGKVSFAPNLIVIKVQAPEFALFDAFLNLA